MIPVPQRPTRTYTLLPYTALFRSNGTSTTRIIRRSPSIVAGTSRELGTPDSRADAAAAMGVTPSIGSTSSMPLEITSAASFASTERSEEHTSELQSLMRNSSAVFCLTNKTQTKHKTKQQNKTET